jgi:uncharacterized protein (TIGR02646 family)
VIQLARAGLVATPRLRTDQEALAAVSDADGPACVKTRSDRGYKSMREALAQDQNSLCAYCEDDLIERENEVDHIRPKDGDQYWWLAFSVPNLVLACRACNNFKSNKWELRLGARRSEPREEPWTTQEQAMLVDPTAEDPRPHFSYRYEGGRWRIAATTDRGLWTIRALSLDRDSFTRRSNEWLRDAFDPRVLQLRRAEAEQDLETIRRVIAELVALTRPGRRWSHFASAIVDAVHDRSYTPPVF